MVKSWDLVSLFSRSVRQEFNQVIFEYRLLIICVQICNLNVITNIKEVLARKKLSTEQEKKNIDQNANAGVKTRGGV